MSKEELDMSNQENVFETILAPMTGTAVAITEVPDPIFIEKILGDGSRSVHLLYLHTIYILLQTSHLRNMLL